jgi:glycosyltransferase involved in cell wall biosynthesis
MKLAFVVRSTLYDNRGGDTVQILQSARHLRALGVEVDVLKADGEIKYKDYDLFHFFNITRPADILSHTKRLTCPFVISPILIDYTGYDKNGRKGLAGLIFKYSPAHRIEYFKTIGRIIKRADKLCSFSYLWKGQKRSMEEIMSRTTMMLPASKSESDQLRKLFPVAARHKKVALGIDHRLFNYENGIEKDPDLVLCVARFEGLKNQENLILALNNTRYKLIFIGQPASNQAGYYNFCRKMAAPNVSFREFIPQEELVDYYRRAKVHVLPSFFENCGLSTLEAAAMGCNVVVSGRGYIREYLGDGAFYCDPGSPASILKAIEAAANSPVQKGLREKVLSSYTWERTAKETLLAYYEALNICPD